MSDPSATPQETANEAANSPAKKGGFIGILLSAVFAGAASFGAAFFLFDAPKSTQPSEVEQSTDKPSAKTVITLDPLETHYTDLDPITLSIQDNTRILKIGLTLETYSDIDYIASDDPRLRDAFTTYLRALKAEHIQDVSYMNHIRAQLLRRAQIVKGAHVVHGVLITDFLVQ